jgi:sigma-B regulation protein RsbU (phosphoserine phosphatase)
MVITGFGDRDMLVRLLRKGSIEYLDKPFSGNYFISVVNSLAEQIKVKKDNTNNLANLEVERREKIGNELKRLRLHYDEMYKQLANAGSIYNRIVRIDKNKLKLPATFHNRPLWNCGGDYAAIRNTSDGIIATVADVTGHDMAASFYTMIINTIFEEHFDKGLTGDLFLDLLNNAILDSSGDNRQVATTVININLAKKLADISIASHTPVMYVSPQNNVIRPIYIRGSLLGIKDNIKNETVRIPINENDRFYLFTDGITGAYRTDYNGNRVFLNDSGIEEFIKNTLDIPFTESSEIIWKNIKEFCRGKFTDDALLLGLEIKFPLIEN